MNKLLLFIIFLSFLAVVSSHFHQHKQHKHRHGHKHVHGKKHFHHKKGHHGKGVFLPGKPIKEKSSSSSSSSSEEVNEPPILVGAPKPTVRTTLAAPSPSTTTDVPTTTKTTSVPTTTETTSVPTTTKTTVTPTTTKTTIAPTTTSAPKCEKDWLSFKRSSELWCVLVVHQGANNKGLQQQEAEDICKKDYSATLTGFLNDDERTQVATEALHQLGQLQVELGGVWIGATSSWKCNTESCSKDDFFWTDDHTKGKDGMKWGKDEPDTNEYTDGYCVQQIIMSPSFASDSKNSQWTDFYKNGELDKTGCKTTQTPPTRLFACGKVAK